MSQGPAQAMAELDGAGTGRQDPHSHAHLFPSRKKGAGKFSDLPNTTCVVS